MGAGFDPVSVVEASYDLSGNAHRWLQRLAATAHPGLGGFATIAVQYREEAGRVWPLAFDGVGLASERRVRDFIESGSRTAPDEGMARVMDRTHLLSVFSFTEVIRALGEHFVDYHARRATPDWPGHDFVCASTPLYARRSIMIGSCFDRFVTTSPAQRRTWSRIRPHLMAGLRLRDAVGALEEEAVLDPDGRCLHAEGRARSRDARDRLRQAARAVLRARGKLRRTDPEAALELWKGLVAGRWSLVDRFENDGRRFLVAIRNDPAAPDPRALTPRERQVVALAAEGAPNKLIAYTLGLSESGVATHLARALRKLGLRRREELVRELLEPRDVAHVSAGTSELAVAAAGPTPPLQGLTPAEQQIADAVVRGLSDREIAAERGTSERTVANQLRAIFRKLGVATRADLVARASHPRR